MELELKVAEIEARSKSNTKRLDEMDTRLSEQEKLVNSVSILTTEMKHFKGDLSEVKSDVKQLLAKPGQRYDSIIDKVLMVFIGAMVSFLLYKGFGI